MLGLSVKKLQAGTLNLERSAGTARKIEILCWHLFGKSRRMKCGRAFRYNLPPALAGYRFRDLPGSGAKLSRGRMFCYAIYQKYFALIQNITHCKKFAYFFLATYSTFHQVVSSF